MRFEQRASGPQRTANIRMPLTVDQTAILADAVSRAGSAAIGTLLGLDSRTLAAALDGARLNLPTRSAILRAIDQRLL